MTVEQLIKAADLKPIALPHPERELDGAYIGDLLSWVMGRARENNAWITIMSNSNIIAVATLADVSCIILAEGVSPDGGVTETAMARGVNLLSSDKSAYEIAREISKLGL
ncbi:MAG: hypothetical protein IKC61_05685 [Clostridia bacterium]|jgi:hypothetical protein|nr:hypothetical protein [Clostridia bacterium]